MLHDMNEDALVKESVPRQAHCATDSFAALETVYSSVPSLIVLTSRHKNLLLGRASIAWPQVDLNVIDYVSYARCNSSNYDVCMLTC